MAQSHTAQPRTMSTDIVIALQPWYLPIKQAHVALVVASGGLFAARGLGVLAAAAWPMRPPLRGLSVAIDTLLLSAGLMLWVLLGLNPMRDAWLGTKLLLLPAYVVVGSLALKRAPTARGKAVAFAAALAIFGFMASVALNHHGLGVFARWRPA